MPGSSEYYFFDLDSFIKKEEEIVGNQEKWLFLLRNSGKLEQKPKNISGPEFDEFFQAATIAGFNPQERTEYEKDMVTELDRKLSLQFAEQKGKAEGIRETASNLKKLGMSTADIVKATGLAESEVQNL